MGDVKQSIYRFRGASHTAFDDLNRLLPDEAKLSFYRLTRNYRTGRTLLDDMDRWFTAWGKEGLLHRRPA